MMQVNAVNTTRTAAFSAGPCAQRSARQVRSNAINAGGEEYAKTLAGIRAPTGYFDPAGLAAKTTPDQVKRYREAELTHGRVCMLAALGFLFGEWAQDKTLFFNWDGQISGPAIVHFQQTRQGFYEPLILAIGISEAFRISRGWADPVENGVFTLRDDYTPGDVGFDPLGICPTDPTEFENMRTKEINNGRLAMIATAGFVAQELVNYKAIVPTLEEKLGTGAVAPRL